MEQESTLFNPLLYAWEGSKRRTPSFSEFVDEFKDGALEIKKALPKCSVINYQKYEYENAYLIVKNFMSRTENEIKFLEIACPLLSMRIKQGNEKNIITKLIKAATQSNVEFNSITFIVALSCLYDDPHGIKRSIGRVILKPHKSMIFNALSDIRSIELTVINQAAFGEKSFSLATRDHGLASLWCALLPIGDKFENNNDIKFGFDLTEALFPRLNQLEIKEIREIILNNS